MTSPTPDLAARAAPHGIAQLLGQFRAELCPEPGAVSEGALTLYARRLLTNQLPPIRHAQTPGLPPLYEAQPDGEWRFNGHVYSEVDAAGWICDQIQACRAKPEGLYNFVTRFAYCQNEHLDAAAAEGRLPSAELIPQWPFVHAVCKFLHSGEDILIEKSRDMMLSWLCMLACLHDLLFAPKRATMTVSRIEKLVDDGGESCTIDSLHGKIRYAYERLPKFLRDAMPLQFKYLQVRNDLTGAHVTGFSATAHAGRGPKWGRAILDEFAWMERSEQVMTSVTRACPRGKVLVSTPNGKANAFYRIRCLSRQVWPTREGEPRHWSRLRVHWRQHPQRDEAWYRAEVDSGSMTEEAVAQELDINYDRSVTGRVYPAFVYERHVAGAPEALPLSDVRYDARRALVLTCDFNHDPLIWILCQLYPEQPTCRVIGEICRRNAIYEDAVLEFIMRFGSEAAIETLCATHGASATERYGSGGVMLAGAEGHRAEVLLHGDATEDKKTVYSRVKMYAMIHGKLVQAGFRVRLCAPAANPPVITRLEVVNDGLRHGVALISPTCEQLIKDFSYGRWDGPQKDMDQHTEDDDGSGLTRSHASSAFGYFFVRHHRVVSSDRARARGIRQNVSALINRWH